MSPKPVIETSQYDDRLPHTDDCGCESCRARQASLGYTEKPGLAWTWRRWLCLAGLGVFITVCFLGALYGAQKAYGLEGKVTPIAAPKALLEARFLCPNSDNVTQCRGELRKALQAIEWQREQNLKLAREMLGKLTDWSCIHRGEGAWNSNTGNGYFGGLQQDKPFMRTYGADMIKKYGGWANLWSPRDQIIVAQRAFQQGRGYRPWPNTARRCGLI